MTIKRKRFLYDITIRFGPSGFRGAHAIDLDQVCDGDEVISEKETAARSITEVEFQSLLGGQSAALIEAADSARRERDIRVAEAVNRQEEAEKKQKSAELQLQSKEGELSMTKAKLDKIQQARREDGKNRRRKPGCSEPSGWRMSTLRLNISRATG